MPPKKKSGGASAATNGLLLTTEEDDRKVVELDNWLKGELSQYRAPRMTEIVAEAKKLGLGAKKTRAWVQGNVPAYRQTTNKIFSTSKPHRIYNTQVLGVLSCDLGFFGKIQPELTRISQTYEAGALVARDVLSHYTYCIPLGRGGKSAKSLVAAFEKLFEEHAKKRDYHITSILFDAERAVTGKQVMQLLQDNFITLHIFRYSRTKSAFAEATIRVLRSMFERFRLNGNEKEWHQTCGQATEYLNTLPIIIRGKKLPFSPNEVTQKTLGKFLAALQHLRPEYKFVHYSIDTNMLSYKFEKDDVVSLKKKSFSNKAIGEKRSEQSIDEATWIVIEKVAYFSDKMAIVKCYVIRPHGEFYGQEMVAEEEALVKIQV